MRDKKCDPLRFVNSGERKLTGQKGLEEGVRRRRKSRRRISSSPGEMQPRPSSILILARVLLSARPSALDDEINLHYPVRKQFWSSGGGEGGGGEGESRRRVCLLIDVKYKRYEFALDGESGFRLILCFCEKVCSELWPSSRALDPTATQPD